MDLELLLEKVVETTKNAAQLISDDFTTTEKGSHINFVTSADIAVEKFLQKQLVALLPGSAFFGEEGSQEVRSADYLWVVDPIDGTVNFSRGIDAFAISVGLVHREQAVLGVVYFPRREELYCATQGGGARCNDEPIHVSDRAYKNALFCTALSLYKKEYAEKCLAIMREVYHECTDIRRFGSCAMDICYLAKGVCELFFEFRTFPWDYAAGTVILKEAGGIITGLDGEEVRFDRTTPLIAANTPENHKKLLKTIKKNIPTQPYEEVLI